MHGPPNRRRRILRQSSASQLLSSLNWLAHLYLSEPTAAFRIGNLLPDLVPMAEWHVLPQEFRRGTEQHQHIDAFTDAHPVVRRSLSRFPAPHRRFAGILTDVYYDHFLSRDWPHYCPVPLQAFVDHFFEGLEAHRAELPPLACARLDQIRRAGWLCCYGEWDGLTDVLRRMGARLRRPCDLSASLTIFKAHYHDFHSDFTEFFPELQAAMSVSQPSTPNSSPSLGLRTQLLQSGSFAASTSADSI